MSTEKLTHWKKNNDSRYISGEDLQDGIEIGMGLKPEMVVEIVRIQDAETFDQKSNSTVIKDGLYLRDLETGKMLYKPVILNKTNIKFCIREFGSKWKEHWLNKPLVLYAQADKRHGYVARFKKHNAAPKKKKTISAENFTKALEAIKAGTYTAEQIKNGYELTPEQLKQL